MYKIKQIENGKWALIGGTSGEKLVRVRITFPEGKSVTVKGTVYYIAGRASATIKIIFPNGMPKSISAIPVEF